MNEKGEYMEVRLNYLKCSKCQHEWIPRKKKVYVCPKCHTYKWNDKKEKK